MTRTPLAPFASLLLPVLGGCGHADGSLSDQLEALTVDATDAAGAPLAFEDEARNAAGTLGITGSTSDCNISRSVSPAPARRTTIRRTCASQSAWWSAQALVLAKLWLESLRARASASVRFVAVLANSCGGWQKVTSRWTVAQQTQLHPR